MHRIDRYQVVGELGRGGMGVVYEVRDPELPRRLALKLILQSAADPVALERFRREAETLARIKHPGVVVVHNLGRVASGPFLVTELVEGESLGARCERGPLPPDEATRIVIALADAVEALHAQRVVHRDLKPDNVILRADGQPVLLDFGLVRDMDAQALTQSGAVMGTPAFMSPEQTGGERGRQGPRTDVYGLGAVLYALLTGRPPFDGPLVQILHGVVLRDPPWPASLRAEVPADLDAVVRRAMAKDPDARYASAAELRADLERVSRGEATQAGQGRHVRRRLLAGGALAGALCVVGALAAFAAGALEADPPPEAPPTLAQEPDAPEPELEAFDPQSEVGPKTLAGCEAWLERRYAVEAADALSSYEDVLSRYLQFKLESTVETRRHSRGHFRIGRSPAAGFFTFCELEASREQGRPAHLRLWGLDPLAPGAQASAVGPPVPHAGAAAVGPGGTVALGCAVSSLEGGGGYNLVLAGGELGPDGVTRMIGGPFTGPTPEETAHDPSQVTALASVGADRAWLLIGYADGRLQLLRWRDVLTGTEASRSTDRLEARHARSHVVHMTGSADGEWIATRAVGSVSHVADEGVDPLLRFWRWSQEGDVARLEVVTAVDHRRENGLSNLAAHPHEPLLAVSTNDPYALLLYDMTSGQPLETTFVGAGREGYMPKETRFKSAHSSSPQGIVFSPDGRLLFTVACEQDTRLTREAELTVWSVRTGRELATLKRPDWNTVGLTLVDGSLYTTAFYARKPHVGQIERRDVSVPGAPR